MALVLQGVYDGVLTVSLDIVSGRVVGAQAVNASPDVSYLVIIDRSRGNRNLSALVAPGATRNQSFPGSQRFDYDVVTAEYAIHVVRG
jgi:hypothetical protein